MISLGADTTNLDQAIKDLWREFLKRVAPNIEPLAEWCMDWVAFRKAIESRMSAHAYDRFKMWTRPPKRSAEVTQSTGNKKLRA